MISQEINKKSHELYQTDAEFKAKVERVVEVMHDEKIRYTGVQMTNRDRDIVRIASSMTLFLTLNNTL